jgi:hypothetical protein
MLRDLDLNRQNCNIRSDDQNVNNIPLTNEHGDSFLRHNDYDDCGPVSGEGGYEDFPPNQQYYNNQRPSPVESDYFYDQYVDFPINETIGNALNNTAQRLNQTLPPFVDFNQNKFNQNLQPPIAPPTSQFTFFGRPLPGLSLGNVWGAGRQANNRASSGENSSRGKGRVQIFKAGDPELQVIVNRPNNDLDSDSRNREPASSVKHPVIDPLQKVDEKFYRPYPYFQTPFSQPTPEKGFEPMIPGMTVGGFIPIVDPKDEPKDLPKRPSDWPKDELKDLPKRPSDWPKDEPKDMPKRPSDWPKDENFKEVLLVTKSQEVLTKRTTSNFPSSSPSSFAHIDKIGSSTVSHLATSISPILSTLVPREELVTEKAQTEEPDEEEEEGESSREVESRHTNKVDQKFEDDIYRQNLRQSSTTFPSYKVQTTTENVSIEKNDNFMSPPISTTTAAEPERESIEAYDDIDNFNGSSALSADHLIAPGSIVSHDIPGKSPVLPAKAGKITKVFSPAPPAANSQEISKLLSPFIPQQYSSEPPSFDNEYQPNQIYPQTFNDNERVSEATQYERNDMDWYFNSYNQSNSNPILNYNLQPYDNFNRSSASKLSVSFTSAIVLIVIRFLML